MSDTIFECPECSKTIEIDADAGGHKINCPSCSKPIVVPRIITAKATPVERGEGSIVFIEQLPRKMIWGIFRFTFLALPRNSFLFLVRSFPWLARLARVLLYIGIWIILAFWPFLITNYIWYLNDPIFDGLQEFVISYSLLINSFGYIWAAICIAGSVWGITKWTSIRKEQKAKANHQHTG